MRLRPPRIRPSWPMTPTPLQSHAVCPVQRIIPSLLATPSPLGQHQSRTLRSVQGVRPRISRFNHDPRRPDLEATQAAAYKRKVIADSLPLRTGILATKKGMAPVFDPVSGERRVATVLQMDRVQVVANKTRKHHGYFAVCVGEGSRLPKNVGRAMMGMLANSVVGEIMMDARVTKAARDAKKAADEKNAGKTTGPLGRVWRPGRGVEEKEDQDEDEVDDEMAEKKWQAEMHPEKKVVGLPPKKAIREFKVKDESCLLPIGTSITPDWFRVGQFVDTRSHTRGMGFAGVMKRWGMKGQGASHGVSLTHRKMGSAGGSQGSGSRVIPGKKMAGRMGNKRHTIQNLEVLMVDSVNGLVLVGGPVSGPKGCLVMVQDALKKPWPDMSTPDAPGTQQAAESL